MTKGIYHAEQPCG